MADTEELERVFTIPIKRHIINVPRNKRAPAAVKVMKNYVRRHMRARDADIWIDTPVNRKIWEKGIQKPPHSIRVRAVKFEDDNLVEISLPEE